MAAAVGSGSRRTSKRQSILDGTENLMLSDGYGAVTFRSVATAAGSPRVWCSTTSRHWMSCSSPSCASPPSGWSTGLPVLPAPLSRCVRCGPMLVTPPGRPC
jgi:hypothetical protein